jgi:RNA polymerase sigma-70 factor (ECF subfamily)
LRAADPVVEEHFAAYFSKLLMIKLRARGANAFTIHEITQETFFRVLKALRSPGGIQNEERLGAFVNAVCNNILFEQHRATSRFEPLRDDYAEHAASDPEVEEAMLSAETRTAVRQVLEQLPDKDARVLRAIFIEERPKDEVCTELAVDRAYLRVLLHRAKNQFRRRYLEKIDDDARPHAAGE